MSAIQDKSVRVGVRIAASILLLAAYFLLFEGGARLIFAYRLHELPFLARTSNQDMDIKAYEMASPRVPGHLVLRPNFREAQPNGIVINSLGFRGPDIDDHKRRPRILALGDSCTFGLREQTYPRAVQAALSGHHGHSVEVINGGVEGYSAHSLILEIDRYLALQPDIVTLYVGWNTIYTEIVLPGTWEDRLKSVWLVRRGAHRISMILEKPTERAQRLRHRRIHWDPHAATVEAAKGFRTPGLDEVKQLAERLKGGGARVVIVTLPGLFVTGEAPSEKELRVGHLPEFTDNAADIAALTETYNQGLRALAAEMGLGLIDLDVWSQTALRPRENYFIDSVHLTPKGLTLIGNFMAERLARIMHHTTLFCRSCELTRADAPSGGIGVRTLVMQRVGG